MSEVTDGRRRPYSKSATRYATQAGRRLSSFHPRRPNRLTRAASAVWGSSRITRQALSAVVVFTLVYGLLQAPWPALAGLRDQLRYYLTADLDLSGAARQVMSSNVRDKISKSWKTIPELWGRLTGRSQPPPPEEASFILPVAGTLTSGYGYRTDPITGEIAFHTGIDIAALEGSPIVAALDGTVLAIEKNASYGNVVTLDSGDGTVTLYAHAKEILVRPGDVIKQGDTIATVGMTGDATSPHCHFEVLISGEPVDPLKLKGLSGQP